MHVGFLPFLPSPVTEYSTVFSAMKNLIQLVGQLKQDVLPFFCDSVFRIIVEHIFTKARPVLKIDNQCLVVFTLQNIYNIELESTSEVLV